MALRGRLGAAAVLAAVGAAGPMAGWGGASSIPGPATLLGGGGSMIGWDGAAGGQETGQVVRVTVTADASETGAAVVSMSYRLEVDPETRAVPFTLLLFAPATVGEISAQTGGDVVTVRLAHPSPPQLEGEIELPDRRAGSGPVVLDVSYRVGGAVSGEGEGVRIVLPMLAVDWAPAEATPGMFQAEVTLPEGMEAREIFPVTPGGGAVPGVARASLQVLPAVVQVRAAPEGSFGLTLPGVLELLVLVAVIACGMAGLRFVRRVR